MPLHQPLAAPIAYGRTAELYDWDAAHVLKLYHTWCPPHWVEHEAHVARVIAGAGIPTPAAGEVLEIDGRRGIVYERVTGMSMLEDTRRRPWLLLRHARSLADLQAQFHRLTVPGLHAGRDDLRHSIGGAQQPAADRRRQGCGGHGQPCHPNEDRLRHNIMTTANMIETLRLHLRPMRADDFDALFEIFTDPQVMTSFDSEPFTPAQMQQWLQRNLDHQAQFGYGLFSVIEKASGRLIGDCGLEQMEIEGQVVAELGYDLCSDVWNQGYATEAASAVRDYAFQALRLPRLVSLIRVGNAASQRVAEKIGMQREVEFERYGSRYWRYAIEAPVR